MHPIISTGSAQGAQLPVALRQKEGDNSQTFALLATLVLRRPKLSAYRRQEIRNFDNQASLFSGKSIGANIFFVLKEET